MSGTIPTGTCDVPVAPVDSDGDGVVDADDTCADTPSGTEVDAKGCAVVTETPIVDTDGDGVADSLDQCANTPTGTAVGLTGCPVTPTGAGTGTGPNTQR